MDPDALLPPYTSIQGLPATVSGSNGKPRCLYNASAAVPTPHGTVATSVKLKLGGMRIVRSPLAVICAAKAPSSWLSTFARLEVSIIF